MNHLTSDELSATLDRALEGAARERAERHLAECPTCRDALAALATQDRSLRSVLEHDPGDAYFDTFAARVEDRIRAAGLQGAQSRLGGDGWLGWLSSPRRLAWAGAVAAVVVGAGVVMLTNTPQRSLLESSGIGERERQQEGAARPEQDGSQDKARAPSTRRDRFAVAPTPPGPGKKEAAAPQQLSGERTRADLQETEATRPAPEPAAAPPASPARAMAVHRNAAGEDVPAQKQIATFSAPPPPAAGATADLKRAKPSAAQPMDQQVTGTSAEEKTLDKVQAAVRLCGRVMDPQQRPLAGATVVLADQGLVTTSDADGRFCLSAAAGVHELSAMAIGYETNRLQVRVEGESSEALVTLRAVSVLDQPKTGLVANGARAKDEAAANLSYFSQPSEASAGSASAMKLSARAESLQTAAAFDAAGDAWAKVTPTVKGVALSEAQFRLAEARFKAWHLSSTTSRAEVARQALDGYLSTAPAGARRDQAVTWRRQLPH